MGITVTAEAEAKIQAKVESGQYGSAAEVIDQALRVLEEHEKLQRLRAAVAEGLEGETVPLTRESWAEAWERAKRRAKAGGVPSADVVPADAAT